MYIIADNEATYFEGDALNTVEQLPAGAWGIGYRPMTNAPFFYKIEDYKTSHGKIYGDNEKIAKHVIDAYKLESDKNVGALFSGNKGLGKSLTIRLIVEEMIKTAPVIIVDQYTGILPSVLSDVKNCVIVLDEFEKMFRAGNKDEDGMNPQESILSILDGTKSISHNLYLLSVNDAFSLNENLVSRPGRIRYHFRYDNISAETISEYCKDNLVKERWGDIESIIEALRGTKVQSLDIVQALVKEMNLFKNESVEDLIKIMNITESRYDIDIHLTISVDGHLFTMSDSWTVTQGICKGWINDACYIKFKLKDVSFKPTTILPANFQIERWSGFYPEVDYEDPFWESMKDSDGDVYIDIDGEFRHKHKVEIVSLVVNRKMDFGAF